MCVSNIHLVPWGRGRVGLDILYSKNYTTPCNGAVDRGCQAPPDLGCGKAGLGWGEQKEKAFLGKKDQDGVLGSGCLVSPFPPLLSDVLCRLVLYLFFFLIEIRAGAGEQGKDLPKGLLPGQGAVMGAPPSYGVGTEPHSKLLINCWLF